MKWRKSWLYLPISLLWFGLVSKWTLCLEALHFFSDWKPSVLILKIISQRNIFAVWIRGLRTGLKGRRDSYYSPLFIQRLILFTDRKTITYFEFVNYVGMIFYWIFCNYVNLTGPFSFSVLNLSLWCIYLIGNKD